MSDRLPPLTALRAFESAARHMSFAKAAEELNVTPAALSFQIKSLEEHLGAPVFRRLNRAVELTEAGKALAPGSSDGFQALAAAWRAAQRSLDDGALTVTAGPAFTAKWLAPRLFEFARNHPTIDLRFAASLKLVDLDREGVDVAIRFSQSGEYPGTYSEPLAAEWACPVMTPDLARSFPDAESLKDAPLLHDESIAHFKPAIDWNAWFDLVETERDTTHGLHFSNADHAIDAALSGAGVALGRRSLVVKHINEGQLVTPIPLAINTKAHFWFICAEGAQTRPSIAAFRDWILFEIKKTQHITDKLTVIDPVSKPRKT